MEWQRHRPQLSADRKQQNDGGGDERDQRQTQSPSALSGNWPETCRLRVAGAVILGAERKAKKMQYSVDKPTQESKIAQRLMQFID
jgi:hypothetical protein